MPRLSPRRLFLYLACGVSGLLLLLNIEQVQVQVPRHFLQLAHVQMFNDDIYSYITFLLYYLLYRWISEVLNKVSALN